MFCMRHPVSQSVWVQSAVLCSPWPLCTLTDILLFRSRADIPPFLQVAQWLITSSDNGGYPLSWSQTTKFHISGRVKRGKWNLLFSLNAFVVTILGQVHEEWSFKIHYSLFYIFIVQSDPLVRSVSLDTEEHKINFTVNIYYTSNLLRGRRVIGISGSLIWSETLMELIFNPCGEFREVRRIQLAKSTPLTYTLVLLGSFQIF